jgi:predicted nucleic acid-binding protein
MCIIIDTNVFGDVFNKESKSHLEFEPVINWILYGKGKIVYGGAKYKNELRRAKKYLKILVEFEKMNKVVRVDDEKIDDREKEIKKTNRHRDFNDEHIIAIVIVSGCVLVCTKDSSAVPFIKDPSFYPKSCKKPKIYSGKRNKNLLADCNIAPICKESRGK